jgi:aspartate/methionine/tyrosine aminotransferase
MAGRTTHLGRRSPRSSPVRDREANAVSYPAFLARLLTRTGLARFLPAVRRLADGGAAFLHYYSDRVLAAPSRELRETVGLLEPSGRDVIDLSQGAPVFDLVPSASTKLPADRRGYPPPWGLPTLREAVAARLRAELTLHVQPADEVLITHGVAGAFAVVLDTFVNPGDRVLLLDPSSPLYRLMLAPRRARMRWLPTWTEAGRTRFHFEHLIRALRGARLIVLTSPANPTGGVLVPEDLEQIAWWANRRDVLIFDDQAFARYRYEGAPVAVGALARANRRTLTAGSVSKGHALTSARVGWLAGHRHLIRPCALTAGLQTPFVPALCQQIALAALEQGDEAFEPIRQGFDSRRRYAFERLQALGLQPAWPGGAFFLWVPTQDLLLTGRGFADRLLRAKRALVTPGDVFGPSGRTYVRISYAADDGRLREGLARLGDFVRELQGRQADRVAA